MADHLGFIGDLMARMDGPMHFRFLLQPTIAIFFGLRDGRRDARAGRPPYFSGLFSDPAHRRETLATGWRSIRKVFVFAMILDLIFQYLVFARIHLIGALIAGLLLAILPYLLLRGLVNRLLVRLKAQGKQGQDRMP